MIQALLIVGFSDCCCLQRPPTNGKKFNAKRLLIAVRDTNVARRHARRTTQTFFFFHLCHFSPLFFCRQLLLPVAVEFYGSTILRSVSTPQRRCVQRWRFTVAAGFCSFVGASIAFPRFLCSAGKKGYLRSTFFWPSQWEKPVVREKRQQVNATTYTLISGPD